MTNPTRNTRFLMWVDAVGGFLVVLGDHVTIGQPSSEGGVDVPILADISRRHCAIHRDGSGYLLDPLRAPGEHEIRINKHPVTGPTVLVDGAAIDLGKGVTLTFRQPHALSATARLDLTSHHKTNPTVDSVLLMSDACVLGPQATSHIVCRKWEQDVLLYRRDEELFCRTQGRLEIDGEECQSRGKVHIDSHIEGETFAIHLESLD